MRRAAHGSFSSSPAASQPAPSSRSCAARKVFRMAAITYPRAVSMRIPRVLTTRLPLAALLAATFVVYVWGLDRNGWANAYYAAAVQAGTMSWAAFFFGYVGASILIT